MLNKHLLLLLCIFSCSYRLAGRSLQRSHRPHICHTPCNKPADGDITIFVHGTVFPMVSHVLQHKERRRGLYRYTAQKEDPRRPRLAQALAAAAPEDYPAHSFYKFYWSGKLTQEERKKAASELFDCIRDHTGAITLIGHSHGCNVALHLAEIADTSLAIHRLVLLAPPVQDATAHLIISPIFKRVYSFYSTADFLQVADPQGLQNGSDVKGSSFFSQRNFQGADHITQARILITGRSPSHRDFMMPTFFKQLPQLLTLLDKAHQTNKKHIMVNIPLQGEVPHLLENHGYTPRRKRHCCCIRNIRFEA